MTRASDSSGNSLAGRMIIVTGASSGMGRVVIPRLAQAGAKVLAVGRRSTQLLSVCDPHPHAVPFVSALDARGARSIVARAITETGSVHGVVHLAGEWVPGPALEASSKAWRQALEANFNTATRIASAALPAMLDQGGGAFVFVASVLAISPVVACAPYACAKAALVHFSRCLALDYGSRGIRSNCICPGLTDTPMTANVFSRPEWTDRLVSDYPIGRLGRPNDVAGLIAFLVSDEASWITGVNIPVDGGYTISSGS